MKHRRGIRSKLAITYLIIAVPLVAVIAIAYAVGYREARLRVVEERLGMARLAAATYDLLLDDLRNSMRPVGRSIATMPERKDLAATGLAEIVRNHPLAFAVHVGSDRRVVHSTDESLFPIGETVDARPAVEQARSSRSPLVIEGITAHRGLRGFFVATPVRGADGRFLGVVLGFVDLRRLPAALPLRPTVGDVNIMDPTGRIAFQSERPRLAGTAPWARRPPVREALSGRIGVSEEFAEAGMESQTLVEVPIGSTGWVAGSAIGNRLALAPLRETFTGAIGMTAVVLIVALLLGALTTRRLARSIESLAMHGSRMGGGDLQQPIILDTGDEVEDVANALEDSRRRLKDYIDSLSEVAEIGRELTSTLDIDDVRRIVLDGAKRLFNTQFVWILRPDETGSHFRPFLLGGGKYMERVAEVELPFGDGAHARVMRTRSATLVRNLQESLPERWRGLAAEVDVRAMALAPLLAGDESVGVIGLASSEMETWREDGREMELLTIFASLVANALNNADLFGRAERERHRVQELADEARRHADELDAVIRSIADPVIVLDRSGTAIRANAAAHRAFGTSPVGMSGGELLARIDLRDLAGVRVTLDGMASMATAGEGAVGPKLRIRDAAKGDRIIEANAIPLSTAEGARPGLVVAWHDITDIERARELSDALNSIDRELGATLEFDEAVVPLVRISADALGAPIAMLLLDYRRRWSLRYTVGLDEQATRAVEDEIELDPACVGLSVDNREPFVVGDAAAGVRLDEVLQQRIDPMLARRLGIGPALVAALSSKGKVVGALLWARRAETRPFSTEHVDFARKVAASAALALETARLYETEREVSRTLQEGLLRMPEAVTGIRFGHLYRSASEAAKVGGDFYDLFELDEDRIGIMIGDVSGKGVEAAALTSFIKDTARAYTYEDLPTGVVLARVNDAAYRLSDSTSFVTVFLGVLDVGGRLRYCGAGHPPAIIRRADGAAHQLVSDSPLIGAFPNLEFHDHETHLGADEVLLLYTDGVIEAKCETGERFGEARLLQFVRSTDMRVEDLPAAVYDDVLRCAGGHIADDIALLALQPLPVLADQLASASRSTRTQPGASPA